METILKLELLARVRDAWQDPEATAVEVDGRWIVQLVKAPAIGKMKIGFATPDDYPTEIEALQAALAEAPGDLKYYYLWSKFS